MWETTDTLTDGNRFLIIQFKRTLDFKALEPKCYQSRN